MKHLNRRSDIEVIRVIWPFIAVIAVLVVLGAISVGIMTSLRTFIAGESIWSKGEKDAIFYLSQYAESGDTTLYKQYETALIGPRSLKNARLALYSDHPDFGAAKQWLINGGVNRQDVPDVIRTFQVFRRSEYLESTVNLWAAGDAVLDRLEAIAGALQLRLANSKLTPDEKEAFQTQIRRINNSINPLSQNFSNVLSDFYRTTASLLQKLNLLAAGCLILLSTVHVRRLILQRTKIGEALLRSDARAKATLASIGEAVIATDQNQKIEFVNAAAEAILGTPNGKYINRYFSDVFKLIDENTLAPLDPLSDDASMNGSAILTRDDGKRVFVRAVTSRIGNLENGPHDMQDGCVIILRDVTPEKAYVEDLAWRATHDNLTGLVDRAEFESRLAGMINRGPEERTGTITLLFLDLDRFKIVNDTCGHGAGDLLLRQIAQTLQSCISTENTVARLGGDEFGVLLLGRDATENEHVAESVRVCLEEVVFDYENESFTVSASIGLLHLTSEIATVAEAMKLSDIACYIAKGRGRDRIHIVDPKDSEIIRQASDGSWTRRLKRALDLDYFCLFAQPIVDIMHGHDATKRPARTELLLRMFNPVDDSIIPPDIFIPAAERYGLMPAIDRWVVRRALATLAATTDKLYVEYGINLSGASIGDERFLAFVKAEFRRTAVHPALVCFEITETTAVANLSAAKTFMNELKALGCHFALDDFGVGVSSFGYLKSLPVDYLKIDGGFVKDMVSDEVSRDLVTAINDIGHAMKCKTIAEYVESEGILRLLEEIGVDHAQGYFVGRPTHWVEEQRFLKRRSIDGSIHQAGRA